MCQTCIYCGNKVNPDNTTIHQNCKDYHEYVLDEMISKLKTKLEILILQKISILKSKSKCV